MFSSLRRVVPFIAIAALVIMASCTPAKKYGCPGGLKFSSALSR